MGLAIRITQALKWSLVKIKYDCNKLKVVGTCVHYFILTNTIINSHGEIPAEKKPRAIPHYLEAMVTFNSPRKTPQILLKQSPFITKLWWAHTICHIFFLTIVSRNWFWKTNPTNVVFRGWQLTIQLFSKSIKSQSTVFSWHLVSTTQRQNCCSSIA